MSTGILILAAGAASRMNRPKMLLAFGSSSILAHILEEVKVIKPDLICLVTGYYHKEIMENINVSGLWVVHNEHWKDGMASSISKAVYEMTKKYPHLNSIMILVSDQPYINRSLLAEMVSVRISTKKGIVAAQYGGIQGTPVLFDKKYFNSLMALTGDTGAKSILQQHLSDTAAVAFSLGAIDIDTAEDYENLLLKTRK